MTSGILEEDNQDEKEALRTENVALRNEIKRLERMGSFHRSPDDSPSGRREGDKPPTLRSSMRTSDPDPRDDTRRIKFSRQSISAEGRVSKRFSLTSISASVDHEQPRSGMRSRDERMSTLSANDRRISDTPSSGRPSVSFGPDVRRTPDALTSVPLVLNIARSLSSVSRKARSKHALFNVARSSSDLDRSPWAVKFESSEQPLDAASVTHLVDVMDKIEVCKSTTKDHPDLLRSIAEGMTLVRVAPGDTVCRQGEPGLFFMVVSEGEFVGESIGCPSRDLKPDDYFGEAIFIHPSPMSSVSVTCTSPAGGSLWTIYTDALRQVLKDTSMKQYLLARGTLDRVPKLLRDSINAVCLYLQVS